MEDEEAVAKAAAKAAAKEEAKSRAKATTEEKERRKRRQRKLAEATRAGYKSLAAYEQAKIEEGLGKLSGTVRSNVHYFEDGNVQLDDGTKFACELKFSKGVGESMAAQVMEYEMEFNAGMEDIYVSMSEQVLQGLRRRLPVTRVKFDWDNKASVHKLASDLRGH